MTDRHTDSTTRTFFARRERARPSRAQVTGLLNSQHPISISVVHVEQHLHQLDIFFLHDNTRTAGGKKDELSVASTRYSHVSFLFLPAESTQTKLANKAGTAADGYDAPADIRTLPTPHIGFQYARKATYYYTAFRSCVYRYLFSAGRMRYPGHHS